MKLASALFREKTNVGLKANTTFNAPGQYLPPYGKTTVRIGGRGASGNYSSGGNYAGEAYAGTNPTTYPYAGTNPTNYGTNPATYAGTNPTTYGTNPATSQYYPPTYYYNTGYTDYFPGEGTNVPYSIYYPPEEVMQPGGEVVTPGNAYSVAGTDYYSTSPGNAYYSPYYNTYYPGSAGTPSNIGGVYFLAGNSDSLAPVVAATSTALSSSPTGIYVTVPAGGYINIENI